MTDHTWGLDKSHFDSPGGTSTIVAEGFGFMTHKAGGDANDGELGAWWSNALPYRSQILLGAYWVLYPGHGSGAGDSFLARLDSQCPGWRDGPFILQLDCEEWGGDPGTMPHLSDIRACANRLRALAPKLMPIVYAPHWAYGDTLSGLGFPLWSSSYTTAKGAASAIYPGDSYSGWAAYGGIVPSIAQFSSTATVAGDSTSDVNCFKGTPQQLSALLAPGWETVAVATLDNDDKAYIAQQIAAVTAYDAPQTDGTPTSKIGRLGWGQGVPDGGDPAGGRQSAWEVLQNLGVAVRKLAADVAALKAAPPQVDTAALAAALAPLIGTPTQADLQAADEAAIRDLVAPNPASQAPAIDTPQGSGDESTPLHDATADDLTKRLRQGRQGGIQGSGQ
jgi:hypothetical protein